MLYDFVRRQDDIVSTQTYFQESLAMACTENFSAFGRSVHVCPMASIILATCVSHADAPAASAAEAAPGARACPRHRLLT